MASRTGMLMKIEFVLDVARKDRRFLNDLTRDTFRTLEESGIDLSKGELIALIDIVRDQSQSTLAPLLYKLREKWNTIIQEDVTRFGQGTAAQPSSDPPKQ